jgi:hypothetical protein
MGAYRCIPTGMAAAYLGISTELLCRWRRRGIGPAYFRLPGAGSSQRQPAIVYAFSELDDWLEKFAVQAGRMPRPVPGRMPGGRNREKTAA